MLVSESGWRLFPAIRRIRFPDQSPEFLSEVLRRWLRVRVYLRGNSSGTVLDQPGQGPSTAGLRIPETSLRNPEARERLRETGLRIPETTPNDLQAFLSSSPLPAGEHPDGEVWEAVFPASSDSDRKIDQGRTNYRSEPGSPSTGEQPCIPARNAQNEAKPWDFPPSRAVAHRFGAWRLKRCARIARLPIRLRRRVSNPRPGG